jgi:hypothetical protein
MKNHALNTNQPLNKIDDVFEDNQAELPKSKLPKSNSRKKIFLKHYKYLDHLLNVEYESYKEKSNFSFFDEDMIVVDANK